MPPQPPPRAVAIVRFSAAGDVLLCSQAIDALAAAWPTTSLVLVTHARYASLLAHHPRLVAVEPLPAGGRLGALARTLRQRHGVEAVLDLHGSWRSRVLTALLRPARRARWRKRTLGEWVRVSLGHAPYRPTTPMAARLHAAVEALVGATLARPAFVLPPRGRGAAKDCPANRPLRVGLSPGAGWATKRWPPARYAQVARALLAAGRQVVLFGSAAERATAAAVADAAPGCINLAGTLDWPATYAAFAKLDVFVAGDTGPMHLARGLGVRVVALFTSTPAEQFDLRGHAPLRAQLGCSPCSFYGRSACPRGDAACLRAIEPNEVVAAVERLLAAVAT